MNRLSAQFKALDVSAWPTVAHTEFDDATRFMFERRVQAVMGYVRGDSIKQIEEATGINRRQLYRCLEHAVLTHPDGRPFGFRALIRYARTGDYVRVHALKERFEPGGAAGAFSQLLERYPVLAGWLLLQVKHRKVRLDQFHTDGKLRTRVRGLKTVHDDFLRQCRAVGLTAADYPFNTSGHAVRSLRERVKVELVRSFGSAARSAGASHLKGLPRRSDDGATPAATRPYQVVELLERPERRRYSEVLRYCRHCMARGYHSVLHQIESVKRCPAHRCALESICRRCGRQALHHVGLQLLESAYRCPYCREWSGGHGWCPNKARPMQLQQRRAFTRLYVERCRG